MNKNDSKKSFPLPVGVCFRADRPKPFLARVSFEGKKESVAFQSLEEAVAWREGRLQECENLRDMEMDRKSESRERGNQRYLAFRDLGNLFIDEHRRLKNLKESSWHKQLQIMERSLFPFFGDCLLHEIDEEKVLEFCMKSLERKVGTHELSRKTLLNHLAVVNNFFKWAMVRKYAKHNPVPDAREQFRYSNNPDRNIKEKVLTEEELKTVLSIAEKKSPEARPVILFAALTGMRRGEIGGLTWSDYRIHDELGQEYPEPRIFVNKQVVAVGGKVRKEDSTKTSRDREISANKTVQFFLEDWKETASKLGYATDGASPMFPVVAKNPENFSKNIFRRICVEARLPVSKRSFHGLRHTFAGWLRMRDSSPREIQILLGHSTPAMAERYGRIFKQEAHGATQRLDGIVPPLDNSFSGVCGSSNRSDSSSESNVVSLFGRGKRSVATSTPRQRA